MRHWHSPTATLARSLRSLSSCAMFHETYSSSLRSSLPNSPMSLENKIVANPIVSLCSIVFIIIFNASINHLVHNIFLSNPRVDQRYWIYPNIEVTCSVHPFFHQMLTRNMIVINQFLNYVIL